MNLADTLVLRSTCPLKAQNAGLFIARGTAPHPIRVIYSHELIFVKQGEMEMWEGERTFHLQAGQTLHLWPGREHGSTKPLPLGLKFYWIHFELEEQPEAGDEHLALIKIPQVGLISQPERLERFFRTFLEDQETGWFNQHSANLLTMLMLMEVAHADQGRVQSPSETNVLATWAHTYIRINYDRLITTSSIAEALGYNADYLGRIYRKVYGCTLTEAIHSKRISVACEFLLDTNMTIDQIANKCGFTDPDYFRRIFRQSMQISPGNYRKEYARIHINTH